MRRNKFRDYLWENLPDSRPAIQELEAAEIAAAAEFDREPFFGLYDYVSQVYWWGVFHPALERGDRALVSRCFEVAESVFRGSDDFLKEAFEIRVIPYLLSWPTYIEYAGPCVQRELRGMFEK